MSADADADRVGRLFTLLLIAAAICTVAYLVFGGRNRPTTEQATQSVRRWSDRMGLPVAGVECDGGSCIVVTKQGQVIEVTCGPETCTLRRVGQ